MLCMNCGKSLTDSTQGLLCEQCQQAVAAKRGGREQESVVVQPVAMAEDEFIEPPPPFAEFIEEGEYAGFWLRFFAMLFDSAIISVICFLTVNIFGLLLGKFLSFIFTSAGGAAASLSGLMAVAIVTAGLFQVFYVLIYYLFYAFFESSRFNGTPGKILFGIAVVDISGDPVSFCRAFGRNLGKIVSSIVLGIGFIMAAFTFQKQGLHDLFANTLVIKVRYLSPGVLIFAALLSVLAIIGAVWVIKDPDLFNREDSEQHQVSPANHNFQY